MAKRQGRKDERHDPQWYMNEPRTRKWLVQCSGCQRIGYRSDAPENFFGLPISSSIWSR